MFQHISYLFRFLPHVLFHFSKQCEEMTILACACLRELSMYHKATSRVSLSAWVLKRMSASKVGKPGYYFEINVSENLKLT